MKGDEAWTNGRRGSQQIETFTGSFTQPRIAIRKLLDKLCHDTFKGRAGSTARKTFSTASNNEDKQGKVTQDTSQDGSYFLRIFKNCSIKLSELKSTCWILSSAPKRRTPQMGARYALASPLYSSSSRRMIFVMTASRKVHALL